MLYDLRIIDPAKPGVDDEYLDGWSQLTVSTDRRAPGVCSFTYPKSGVWRDRLLDKQIVAFLQDGREGTSCRYVLRGLDGNKAGEGAATEGWSFRGLWDALRDAVFLPASGSAKTRTWTNKTPGTQLLDVMGPAAARGAFAWWGYQGCTFTAATDSNGVPWPVIPEMQHEYGITIYDVWDWLVQNHWVEVSTTGGYLNAYVPDKRGKDRTGVIGPAAVSEGLNLVDGPEQTTWDDFLSDLTVIGGETPDPADETKLRPRIYVQLSTGVTGWGRREKTFRVTGVQNTATLTAIGTQYMAGFREPRSSRTYSVTLSDGITTTNAPVPMIDYEVADIIPVSLADGVPARREVPVIISLTCDPGSPGTYLVTVNDWLDNRDVKIDRLLTRYGSGAT